MMTDKQLAEIRSRLDAATPGPWGWDISVAGKHARLESKSKGRWTVMDFVRWGMDSAAPRFLRQPLLERVDEFAKTKPGLEHHAKWDADVDHPDAQLIANAPADIAALLAEVDRLRAENTAALTSREGWAARSREQFARIGHALDRVRKKRATGEPARDDATEVEAIVAERDRLRTAILDVIDCPQAPSGFTRGHAPMHAHSVPGAWDSDNKPELAGQPCEWCAAWERLRGVINKGCSTWII